MIYFWNGLQRIYSQHFGNTMCLWRLASLCLCVFLSTAFCGPVQLLTWSHSKSSEQTWKQSQNALYITVWTPAEPLPLQKTKLRPTTDSVDDNYTLNCDLMIKRIFVCESVLLPGWGTAAHTGWGMWQAGRWAHQTGPCPWFLAGYWVATVLPGQGVLHDTSLLSLETLEAFKAKTTAHKLWTQENTTFLIRFWHSKDEKILFCCLEKFSSD